MTEGKAARSGNKREEVAVIGAGRFGCETALMLAKAGYQVTLVEAQGELLNGATAVASQEHQGAEYLDPETSLYCLRGALIGRLTLPLVREGFFTDARPMKFMVADETQREGRLTHEMHYEHYNNVSRKEYELRFEQVREAKGWSRETTARNLFGFPEEGKFCKKLSPAQLKDYPGIAGGFQTMQRGFNNIYLLSAIEHALEEEQKNGRVTILKRHRVAHEGIEALTDGYRIHFDNGPQPLHVSQYVLAAWDRNPHISPLTEGQSVTVYNRAMLYIYTAKSQPKQGSAFVLQREHGYMYMPLNEKAALCYLPLQRAAYRGGDKTLTAKDSVLPDLWPFTPDDLVQIPVTAKQRKDSAKVEKIWRQAYHELLVERLPWLAGSEPILLVIRNTLNFDDALEKRRHRPTWEQVPGGVVGYPTKVTLASLSAREATHIVRERSRLGRDAPLIAAPDFETVLQSALAGEHWLGNVRKDALASFMFSFAHGDIPKYVHGQRSAAKMFPKALDAMPEGFFTLNRDTGGLPGRGTGRTRKPGSDRAP